MLPLIHEKITRTAISRRFPSDKNPALKVICKADGDSDNAAPGSYGFCANLHPQHVSNCRIQDSSDYIRGLTTLAENEFKRSTQEADQRESTRHLFNGLYATGRMFHAVQDFYSHTNWIDLTRDRNYASLEVWNEDGTRPNLPADKAELLKNCHFESYASEVGEHLRGNLFKERTAQNTALYNKIYFSPDYWPSHYEINKDMPGTLADRAYNYNAASAKDENIALDSGFDVACIDAAIHTRRKWDEIQEHLGPETSQKLAGKIKALETLPKPAEDSIVQEGFKEGKNFFKSNIALAEKH